MTRPKSQARVSNANLRESALLEIEGSFNPVLRVLTFRAGVSA
jgi:hypothetical protein